MFDQKERTHRKLFIYNGLRYYLVTALGLSCDDPLRIGLTQSPELTSVGVRLSVNKPRCASYSSHA
jgi:hypothetical protein